MIQMVLKEERMMEHVSARVNFKAISAINARKDTLGLHVMNVAGDFILLVLIVMVYQI